MYRPERRASGDNGVSANGNAPTLTMPVNTITDPLEDLFESSDMQCGKVRHTSMTGTSTTCTRPTAWATTFPCGHDFHCCAGHHALIVTQPTQLLCEQCPQRMNADTASWRRI